MNTWRVLTGEDETSIARIYLSDGEPDTDDTTTLCVDWQGCTNIIEMPLHFCDLSAYATHLQHAYDMAAAYFNTDGCDDPWGVAPLREDEVAGSIERAQRVAQNEGNHAENH